MNETIALIDKIIEEHKTLLQNIQTMEQVANDAEAIAGLEKAKDAFIPGRLEQAQGLEKLQELQQIIDQGIQSHFNREETALLSAFEKHGDQKLAAALQSLLREHEDLRNRFAQTGNQMTELTKGGLSGQVWGASAYDMRAYITHTRKLLKKHAGSEQELLHTLRKALIEAQKGKD